MADDPFQKIHKQMAKAGLPADGAIPFKPQIATNKKGEPIIIKAPVRHGPKKGKYGYVDSMGRIWIKDRAHGKYPDHWDVQENGGAQGHTRVDLQGNILP